MKFKVAAACAGLGVFAATAAFGDDFKVGDHVLVGSINLPGVVTAIGRTEANGGVMLTVLPDRARGQGSGIQFNSLYSNVTHIADDPAPGTATNTPAAPQAPDSTTSVAPANATEAKCQQLIRDNYPATGADQTISVNFLSFQMGGARPYEAVYANDRNGRGHTVSASPIHAKYTVLTHFADPLADDQLRTYDAKFMCYRSPVGGWVVEMISRLPGGETAQYIHKG